MLLGTVRITLLSRALLDQGRAERRGRRSAGRWNRHRGLARQHNGFACLALRAQGRAAEADEAFRRAMALNEEGRT